MPVMPASHIEVLVHVSAAPLLIQVPATAPGKEADNGPNAWAPAAHV